MTVGAATTDGLIEKVPCTRPPPPCPPHGLNPVPQLMDRFYDVMEPDFCESFVTAMLPYVLSDDAFLERLQVRGPLCALRARL